MPNPYIPMLTKVKSIVSENKVNDIKTLELEFKSEEDYNTFDYIPGQFAEISLIGKGECPIGIASSPTEEGSIKFTIKKMGEVTSAFHNCEIGENNVIAAQSGLAGTSKVGKNCKFGGQVGLAGHLTIGDNVFIGAQSGVAKSVNSNQIILGSPAIEIKEAIRAITVYKYLPKLRDEVIQLQKEIKSLKELKINSEN